MKRPDKLLLAIWIAIGVLALAMVCLQLTGCYPSLIGRLGSTDGGDRLTLPSGEGGGSDGTRVGETLRDSEPSAPPWWSERWAWETLGGVGFALATGYVNRKQSLANRALVRTAAIIEAHRTNGGTVRDVIGDLKQWRNSGTDPAARVLHAAVKRATR